MLLKHVASFVALFLFAVASVVAQPVITGVSLDIAPDSVIVTVTTDVQTTVVIDYGETAGYGSQESSGTLATSHDIVLGGLSELTTYHFQVTVTDAGLVSTQDPDDTFTTESYPVISSLTVDAVSEHTFTISFETSTPTTSDYWIRPTGGPGPVFNWLDGDFVFRSVYSLELENFRKFPTPQRYRPAAGLAYDFAVIVQDADGNTTVDSSGTFTTLDHPNDAFVDGWQFADVGTSTLPGYSRFDDSDDTFYIYSSGTSLFNKNDRHGYIYKPVTGNFEFTAYLEEYAGMQFSHTKAAALFRASLNGDSEIYAQSFNWLGDDVLYYRPAPGVQHIEVTRSSLQPGDGDPIWMRMKREGNDFTVWYSLDGVNWILHGPATVNAALPLNGLAGFAGLGHVDDYYGEIGVNNVTLTEPADVTAPTLSNVDATPVNNSATIDYDANEWVTTVLEYGTTVAYGTTVNSNTLHVTNSIELTGLLYNQLYHYRIKAYDSDANELILGDMTFMTEPEDPLAVELAAFSGRVVSDREVQLLWSILSSDGIARFDIQQRRSDGFEVIESMPATGEIGDFSVRLRDLEYGKHNFRLRIIEADGSITYSNEVELLLDVPGGYEMSDVYPNPFESTAQFTLTVRESQAVVVEVFNLAGQRVDVLFDGVIEAASPKRLEFDGSGLAGGVYFYRALGDTFVATEKMVLVK